MPRSWKALILILCSAAILLPAASGADVPADSTGTGWGDSYWGPIPPPADAEPSLYTNPSMPLWEGALVWPYRVLFSPLWALSVGVGAGVSEVENSKTMALVETILSPRVLIYGFRVNLTAGGLPGFGGGVTFFHNRILGKPGNKFEIRAAGSVRGSNKLTLGMLFPGETTDLQLGAGYRIQPNARYFGLGPRSGEDRESFYTLQQTWVGVATYRHLPAHLGFETEVLYSEVGARGPGEFEPRLDDEFAGEVPPGFGRTSDGVSLSLALNHDNSAGTGRPREGGRRRVKISRFEGTGGEEASFWTYRVELQQFLPLWHTNALGVRTYYTRIGTDAGSVLPFQRMMVNDDPDLLRGYEDFRFRDRGMVAGSVEYRWPVWGVRNPRNLGLDAYLFSDLGQVFDETREIALDRLAESYGFGFRLANDGGFLARLEFAFSREETVIRFRSDQLFQFDKGSIFHGRYPIPQR